MKLERRTPLNEVIESDSPFDIILVLHWLLSHKTPDWKAGLQKRHESEAIKHLIDSVNTTFKKLEGLEKFVNKSNKDNADLDPLPPLTYLLNALETFRTRCEEGQAESDLKFFELQTRACSDKYTKCCTATLIPYLCTSAMSKGINDNFTAEENAMVCNLWLSFKFDNVTDVYLPFYTPLTHENFTVMAETLEALTGQSWSAETTETEWTAVRVKIRVIDL